MKSLVVSHIWKSFGKQQVLKDVSLSMEPGKIYGIVGYNGSGKSVLFKCICGLLIPDQGEIVLDGSTLEKGKMLPDTGILIEGPAYLKDACAYRNLQLLYQIRNKPDKDHLFRILEKVGLEPESKKHVGKFSLGMKQRLGIAQVIMEDPGVLILDEPMNGLDKQGVKDMQELFLGMKKQGKIIMMASHNKYDIELLCDECYEMDGGKLNFVEKNA